MDAAGLPHAPRCATLEGENHAIELPGLVPRMSEAMGVAAVEVKHPLAMIPLGSDP